MFPDVRPDAERITEFETIYSDSARIKVRITGVEMLRFRENNDFVQIFPNGVQVEFFDDFGAVTSTLTAGYGTRNETQEQVIVRDSVVWQSTEGDRLDTEELVWEAQEERIFSDRFVRLRQGRQVITGIGFESNQNFTESRVRAVQGVVQMQR